MYTNPKSEVYCTFRPVSNETVRYESHVVPLNPGQERSQADAHPMTPQAPDTQPQSLTVTRLAAQANGVGLLENVTLTVDPGRLVGLTGPSGCGKTTLLRTIAGLIDSSGGTMQLGSSAPEDIGWPAFRRSVLLVDQQPVLLDGTVHESLSRPFAYQIASGAFPSTRAKDLLDSVGLGAHRLSQDAQSLSVGQQQRVCLIRALLLEPAFLLLDEPTAALDAENVSTVEQLIREETNNRGIGALVVTHDRDQAARWCDEQVDLGSYQVRPAKDFVQ